MSANRTGAMKATKKYDASHGVTQAVRVLSIVCALFLALPLAGAAALDRTDRPPPPSEPTETDKFEIDPKVCNVTHAMVENWIGNNSLTEALNKAYLDIVKDWSNLEKGKFGHDKSKNIGLIRDEAFKLMRAHQGALYKMSVKVTANLIEACDTCRVMNTWGKLQHIKENTSLASMFSAMDTSKLTKQQLDNSSLAATVDTFMDYEKLVRVLANYPPNYGSGKRTEKNKECYTELDKFGTAEFDQNKCYKSYVKKDHLEFYGKKILSKLKSHKSKKADNLMVKLPEVTCLPLSNYRYITFALSAN